MQIYIIFFFTENS